MVQCAPGKELATTPAGSALLQRGWPPAGATGCVARPAPWARGKRSSRPHEMEVAGSCPWQQAGAVLAGCFRRASLRVPLQVLRGEGKPGAETAISRVSVAALPSAWACSSLSRRAVARGVPRFPRDAVSVAEGIPKL